MIATASSAAASAASGSPRPSLGARDRGEQQRLEVQADASVAERARWPRLARAPRRIARPGSATASGTVQAMLWTRSPTARRSRGPSAALVEAASVSPTSASTQRAVRMGGGQRLRVAVLAGQVDPRSKSRRACSSVAHVAVAQRALPVGVGERAREGIPRRRWVTAREGERAVDGLDALAQRAGDPVRVATPVTPSGRPRGRPWRPPRLDPRNPSSPSRSRAAVHEGPGVVRDPAAAARLRAWASALIAAVSSGEVAEAPDQAEDPDPRLGDERLAAGRGVELARRAPGRGASAACASAGDVAPPRPRRARASRPRRAGHRRLRSGGQGGRRARRARRGRCARWRRDARWRAPARSESWDP